MTEPDPHGSKPKMKQSVTWDIVAGVFRELAADCRKAGIYVTHRLRTNKYFRICACAVISAIAIVAFSIVGLSKCSSSDIASEAGSENGQMTVVLDAEENGGSVIKKLGEYNLFLAGRFDLGLRAIVWRSITDSGPQTPKVRIGFGYWGAEGLAVLQGEEFKENHFYQLTPNQCQDLIQLTQTLVGAKFEKAADHIGYRDIDASYGSFKMRKYSDGIIKLHFWDEENSEIWLEIDPKDFTQFLKDSIATAKTLEKHKPSVIW